MLNIAPYIAKYVRSLHARQEHLEIPYTHSQFGVVLMVDIVGFSALTTKATEKGDSGAEAVALEIGAYMGECIEIIEHFGGDVVKFLGDAVLVSFQANNNNEDEEDADVLKEKMTRQKNLLVRRAVECGVQLLARQSHYRVYLTAEERSKYRTLEHKLEIEHNNTIQDSQSSRNDNSERFFIFDESGNTTSSEASVSRESMDDLLYDRNELEGYSTSFNLWSLIPILFSKGRKNKVSTTSRSDTSATPRAAKPQPNAIDLELHIALSCGMVTNIILGDPINSTLNNNNNNNNNSRNGNKKQNRLSFINTNGSGNHLDHTLAYNGRLEYAICGPAVESLEDALSTANAGEMSITAEAYELFQNQSTGLSCEKRNQFYVVKNYANTSSKKRTHQQPKLNGNYFADRPGLLTHAAALNIEPLIPRTRETSFLELSSDPNPNYLKYINRSALYRLQHSPDDNFAAQFREATIMFISLGKLNPATPEGLNLAQKSVQIAIQTLIKYEGVLQQFAVDDKGATLLAVFGLPPLSHEIESIFAAKAAVELRDVYLELLDDFAISLSTGVIFNAVLPHGNPYRRDPAIAGNTIILAVRMLKSPHAKKNIVCDATTKQKIGRLCDFEYYGNESVKGKTDLVPIYGIIQFAAVKSKRISTQSQDKNSDFVGYKSEMGDATYFIDEWEESPNNHVLVIAGPSGVGKSFFCNALGKRMSGTDNTVCCWSSSTEVEKSSKYYLAKNALLALFEVIDSFQVPQITRRRSYFFSGSIGALSTDSNTEESLSSSVFPTTLTSKENSHHVEAGSSSNAHDERTEFTNETVELITRCLRICGEEEELLPLFKVVFSALAELPDNRYTQRLDSRGRDILFCGLVTRMIRHVSDHVGLVFILDDVQWADSASIRLLHHIHEHCQKVLLIIATRPIKDYNVTFTNELRETGSYEEINLNGLGSTEVGEIILQTLTTFDATSVSPEIIRVIQKRTEGNPLYIKNVAITLKDLKQVAVVDSVLVPVRFDIEASLKNIDYEHIIKMQFDRLEASFQEFLTVASCLDQYFTIEEVQSVIRINNTDFKFASTEEAAAQIEKFDVYHFLQKVDDMIVGLNDDVYTFTHITIPQSIYNMTSYEHRIFLHRLLAKYYDSIITREYDTDMLTKVTRHYLRTDILDRQLFYLVKLADLNMRSFLLPEATMNLQKVVQILDEDENLATKFGRLRRSDIYRRLGMCFTMRTQLREGEMYLRLALECLDEAWPQSEPEFLFKFWKSRMAQYQHRKFNFFVKKDKDIQRDISKRVVEIMTQLSNIHFYTGKGRFFVYSCLVGLNACERLDEVGPNYTLFLARVSLISWLNDEKEQSIFYITKALRYMDEKNDADTLTICALLCFAAGKFKNARELLYQSILAVKTLGVITDCQAFYRSVGLVITMRVFEGTLDHSPDDMILLKEMANTAHTNCDFEAEIWLSVYNVGNALIMDRLRDCAPFIALLEVNLQNSADFNKIAIHGTLLCYYARMRNYEAARSHTRSLVSILPLLTVTPNIFPIFGLIFATMGLYCMIEDEQVDLVSTGDSKNYDRFILGVSRINHAFQQVKFWEFTQPCLYLARALPYISTGRTVEGFMVLQHGVMEMRFIQEIRFLKAYYWASLGKYAFTTADRVEWTQSAKADFEELQIPAHVYCNPDPETSYSRDIPTDITV